MKELLLTSSVLILALLLLRRLFRTAIPRRVQYALWGLVLIRLLIPVSLPAVDFSVLTAAQPVGERVTARLEAQSVYVLPVDRVPSVQVPQAEPVQPGGTVPTTNSAGYAVLSEDGQTVTTYASKMTGTELLALIWKIGVVVMACWLALANLRFWQKLHRSRILYPVEGYSRKVWLVEEGLNSPCLFGLFRPAVYLTPAAISTPERLRHVLAHEETHARHLDPLWSLLRCVCLAAYWFDPLVWWAALASRADCELACDEGALRRLGEEERIAYGRTLLSLVPVRKSPANPLLSATTMAAGKRELKDRITRIAQKPRRFLAATLAAAVLVAVVSACTFTGVAAQPETDASGPLTGAELAYFNEEFFNGDEYNIRNQFLSSTYEKPEDIDLFELFYCGLPDRWGLYSSTVIHISEAENLLVFGGSEPVCPRYKAATYALDTELLAYTGLTVAETSGIGLEHFTYLEDYDAYYWEHGDTNYRSQVDISAGEREDDLIHLYYEDNFMGGGWKCVTLRETEDDGYYFVSNLPCEKPVIPTVYPEGEPWLTIPLDGLEPYQVPEITVERHTNDCAERLDGWIEGENGHTIRVYRSTDGNVYAAVVYNEVAGSDGMAEWDVGCFFTLPSDLFSMYFFSDLFGCQGLVLSYSDYITGGPDQGGYIGDYYDYYTFDADGTPSLLARAYGVEPPVILDLNGDGENELAAATGATAQIFFQRDGQVYQADVVGLLQEAWPELEYWDYGHWNVNYRCLYTRGFALADWDENGVLTADCVRYCYFDGRNLLVYKDTRETVDHVLEGVTAPDEVLAAAKAMTEEMLQTDTQGMDVLEDGEYVPSTVINDDWRITALDGPYYEDVDGLRLEIWHMNYELHTTTPQLVVLAGGRYITEDAWVSPGDPHSQYLLFRRADDGSRSYIFTAKFYDDFGGPGTENFHDNIRQELEEQNLVPLSPAHQVQGVLNRIMEGDVVLNLVTPLGQGGGTYVAYPDLGNGRNRQLYFTDPDLFAWTAVDIDLPLVVTPTLTISSPDGAFLLQFTAGSDLVLCREGDSQQWFQVARLEEGGSTFDENIFSFMRFWYDEVEMEALQTDIVIPDVGQSHEEAARAWIEQYEGAHLNATSGSKYKYTYVDIPRVEEDTERTYVPEPLSDQGFWANYSVVFVPESQTALDWSMAGNTGPCEEEDAPEGAFQYWRCGYFYLTGDGWTCDGVGTG